MTQMVTLVRPSVDVLHKFSKPVECLALGYLAAAVRHIGHDATLLDGMLYDWSVEETARRILDTGPALVGFTVVLNYLPHQVEEIASLLRAGGFAGPIIVGGHSVSFFPDRVLSAAPSVDAVICGEGELPIQDIVRAIAAGRGLDAVAGVCYRADGAIRTNGVRRLDDLELLAHPARDLTAEIIDNDGLAAMSTSRGCYARCNFCSIPRFYGLERGGKGLASGDWLGREPASMAAEVLDLHEQFGLLELLIVDDEFFGGNPSGIARALHFADLLAAAHSPVTLALSFRAENADRRLLERLRAGGLRHCFVGLESGVDSDLRLYGKNHTADQNRNAVAVIKDLGLSFQPGFMMFNYASSISQLRRNLEFLRDIGECKPVTVNSSVEPHFGTPLLRLMRREDALLDLGTRMSARYKDPRVAVARIIAEESASAFQRFMNVIAGIQSAITYEWRRLVPGREPDVQQAIDRFEDQVNDSFVAVFEAALQALDAGTDADTVLGTARERITSVVGKMSIAQSLLLLFVQKREGAVTYRTQRLLMAEHAATT